MKAMDFLKLMEEERRLFYSTAPATVAIVSPCFGKSRVEEECTEAQPVNDEELQMELLCLHPVELCRVGAIDSMYYADNVISKETEQYLLQLIEEQTVAQPWRKLRNRRLQCWGRFPTVSSSVTEDLSKPMPQWLNVLIQSLDKAGISSSSHIDNVLINQYEPDEGILHHTDGPAYHDRVAILSLGSDCLLSFRRKLSPEQIGIEFGGDVCSVLLRRRSLFIFEKDAYVYYMHGIAEDEPVQDISGHGPCINVPSDAQGNQVRHTHSAFSYRLFRSPNISVLFCVVCLLSGAGDAGYSYLDYISLA